MLLKIHFFFITMYLFTETFIQEISKYIGYEKNILKIQYTYTYDRTESK